MKRLFLLLMLLLIPAHLGAQGLPPLVTSAVQSVAAAESGVTLVATTWPPGQAMKPGVSVLIQVRGMEQADGGATQPKTKWHIVPAYDDDATMLFYDMNRQPMLFFAGSQAGSRTVFLQIESPGLDALPRCDFDYGKPGPNPKPDPKPEPKPEPNPNPPLPPLANLKVVILLESDNQRSGLEGVYLFQHLQAVQKYLSGLKVWWTTLDNSQPMWAEYSPYVPTDGAPPYLVFVDGRDSKVAMAKPFGVSEYETINMLKELGVK